MWLSLGGSMLCVVLMFVISWWTALVTLAAILALYLIVSYQKPGDYIDFGVLMVNKTTIKIVYRC